MSDRGRLLAGAILLSLVLQFIPVTAVAGDQGFHLLVDRAGRDDAATYQKIHCSTRKITREIAAQKMGRLSSGR